MKITFLGTAAAEGVPAIFCNCEYCQNARLKGGKNIRTRSQAIIDDCLLIDYPPDSYMHMLKGELRFDKVKALIFTHSHSDHCYPHDLILHSGVYAKEPMVETLQVYCGKGVYNRFLKELEGVEFAGMNLHLINPFESFVVNGYIITPLPARHDDENCYIYIIEKDHRHILYANDTGYFFDNVFSYIEEKKIRFDFINYDCTAIDVPVSDEYRHMGIANILKCAERLKRMGAVDANTIQCITHFSHGNNPDQDRMEELVKNIGFSVAFDGYSILI